MPRTFGTSTQNRTPAGLIAAACSSTSAASASWGIHFGETKLVTSI